MLFVRLAAIAAIAVAGLAAVAPAQALTMAECSVKYQAAQKAGTLNGLKWNDFRKANCGTSATAAPVAVAPAKTAPAPKPASPADEPTLANTEKAAEPSTTNAVAPRGVTFPKAIAGKYASESPGKARMHTCLDQYKVNKASNSLAGLTWIKKGGGYYSICNTKLKG
jgi:hypothetical protein